MSFRCRCGHDRRRGPASPADCPAGWRTVAFAVGRGGLTRSHATHNGPMPDTADARAASHLARNLVSLRHVRGLTQDGLAKAAAVPRSTVANLESGAGNPS